MKRKLLMWPALFLAVLAGSAITLAQTQNDASDEQAEPQEQPSDDSQSGNSNNDEDFVPTEEISEGLSVSFPVDI